MEANALLLLLLLLLYLLCAVARTKSSATNTTDACDLSSCLLAADVRNISFASPAPSPSTYYQLLNSSIRNLRFTGPEVPKPIAIVIPQTEQHLRSAVLCCRRASVAIRVRSGGHSYEGLSYVAEPGKPFAVIDLANMNRVRVDAASATAWVEAGATLGEIYHAVAQSSRSLALSAGSCPTIGSGGHILGGGFGLLSRKYGLAADSVEDAVLVDSDGRVRDRKSMGEDVFWAIRGGGGGSWGVVYAWRLRLVPVPERVTGFLVTRLGTTRGVAELLEKWQHVAPRLPDEFYLSTTVRGKLNGSVAAAFTGMFLGRKGTAVSILRQWFPELGVLESDCVEMSWIDSVVYFAGLGSANQLLDRVSPTGYFKAKSDYVQTHISIGGLMGALDLLASEPKAYVILDPYGGAMGRIRSDHLPFPHRAGNLYSIQYMINWTADDGDERGEGYIEWLRGFYAYTEPLVSRNPRSAYVNYVDLDLGSTGSTGQVAVDEARVWGQKYFLGNFDRLVRAKTAIDPDNVFSDAQSIPPCLKEKFRMP